MIRTLFTFALLLATALAGTNEAGLKFLAAKEKEDGVVKLASGLMYKEITAGTGKTPKVGTPTK